jgi:Cu(I)/Ag(I) efflux system membrane fusion protein
MKFKDLTSNKYLRISLFLLTGFLAGWIVFHQPRTAVKEPESADSIKTATIWTCSMHPQIRKNEPGLCPLCGMDLIPLTQDAEQVDPNTISMTENAARIAEIQTMVVSVQDPVKKVRLYGQIAADERLVQTQPAHLAGRIEQLLVNFTGEEVRKGQPIARIYSPLLVTAQQELQEALKMQDTAIISAARNKLRQWKFTDGQIADIESSGQVKSIFDVTATVSGVITDRKVSRGDYVQQGSALFEIADLSHVWALFDAYETDIPWIKKGDKITFSLQSLPGQEFSGQVAFIDPVMDAGSRVARVRVEAVNTKNMLKPGMFATGNVESRLEGAGNKITVPHSAILWTGTRSIVYMKIPDTSQPTFEMREITLGPDLGDSYVVEEGLQEGEEIVTNGTFNIDASAQLLGKRSMMNGSTDSTQAPVAVKKVSAPPALAAWLRDLYGAYDELKNAFVDSNSGKAAQAAKRLVDGMHKLDMKLIGAGEMNDWKDFSTVVETESANIIGNSDVDMQRVSFAPLSNGFYKILKMYGSSQPVYYQYCPMAFDNKGAYWLSESKKISNPYFGQAMLTCGETKEVINQ